MAWKRSSVRSRPGPPYFQQLTDLPTDRLVAFDSKLPKHFQESARISSGFTRLNVFLSWFGLCESAGRTYASWFAISSKYFARRLGKHIEQIPETTMNAFIAYR